MFTRCPGGGSAGFLVALLVGAAACAGATGGVEDAERSHDAVVSDADKVQMNDVSVLFPLATSPAEAEAYLAPWNDGRGGKLFPESVYRSGTGASASTTVGHPIEPGLPALVARLDYGTMRAVGFRLDPCFAVVGPVTSPETCQNQLRIIFQSLVLDGDGPNATDHAVHAFYSLTREELLSFLDEARALRREQGQGDDDLGPLAVHPLLVKQGLLGPYAKGVTALVSRFAGEANLTRFTVFTQGANGLPAWSFGGFDVGSDGRTSKMAIPTLPGADPSTVPTEESFSVFAIDRGFGFLSGVVSIGTTAADRFSLLFHTDTARAAPLAEQQEAIDSAIRVMNPDFHSPNTIDCVSCHVAEPTVIVSGGALGLSAAGNRNAFVPDPAFVPAANMQQTAPMPADTGLDLHLFSYLFRHPMIAKRVINETASVVTYLNGTVLPSR